MALRLVVSLFGAALGVLIAIPFVAATGWSDLRLVCGIGGGLGLLAVAEKYGWVRTRDDLTRPTSLMDGPRR